MKKRRTRNHIIADLSANHVEKHVLLCGYTVERVVHDYGVDLLLSTYTEYGEVENETVKIQVKATDNLPLLKDGQTIAVPIALSDLEYWLGELLPVILIVFDAQADVAYWLYVQAYAQERTNELTLLGHDGTTVHLQTANVVNSEAIRRFARFKADIIRQRPEVNYRVL